MMPSLNERNERNARSWQRVLLAIILVSWHLAGWLAGSGWRWHRPRA
jgi:hypothetical protein